MQDTGRRIENTLNGRVNRRDFLLGGAVAGTLAGSGILTLGRTAKAGTAKKGGHLRLGSSHGSTTDSLDPATSSNDLMTSVFYTAFSQLTEVNAKGELEPLLAESFESSADAITWTFNLRKGVEFHNGKSFGADDVIATMNHHRGEDSKSVMNSIANQIEEMNKDGDHRVIFRLREGNADLPFLLSATQFGVMPAQDDGTVAPMAGIGTGAYAVKNFDAGVRIEYARNANFFRPDRANFDTAEALVIADPVARQTALISGEIDVMDRVELKTLKLLKRRPGIKIVDVAGTLHYTFPMRTDTAPFDNNDVRLALKYAVDREEMLQKILHGYGTLGNDHPISPANRFHASALPQRQYDPDKARFHAKKAGMENLNVDLSSADAGFPGAVDAATLYKEHAAKAGITINVVREPNDGYWSNVWMKKPWCACYWSGRPTEDWMFTDAYSAASNWNDSFWKDERFNNLLKEARAELDDAKRGEMYAEMQTLVRDEGGVVIPMYANHVLAHSDKLAHGEDVAGNWDKDGGKLIERWWFA